MCLTCSKKEWDKVHERKDMHFLKLYLPLYLFLFKRQQSGIQKQKQRAPPSVSSLLEWLQDRGWAWPKEQASWASSPTWVAGVEVLALSSAASQACRIACLYSNQHSETGACIATLDSTLCSTTLLLGVVFLFCFVLELHELCQGFLEIH